MRLNRAETIDFHRSDLCRHIQNIFDRMKETIECVRACLEFVVAIFGVYSIGKLAFLL